MKVALKNTLEQVEVEEEISCLSRDRELGAREDGEEIEALRELHVENIVARRSHQSWPVRVAVRSRAYR